MKCFIKILTLVVSFFAFASFILPCTAADADPHWEKSLVTLKIDRNDHDFFKPWFSSLRTAEKMGIVVSNHEILTTADSLWNHTLVRVQKGGRGKWWNGKLSWVDYHANLALVQVDDESFWEGVEIAPLAEVSPTKGSVVLRRWKDGVLETWNAEVRRLSVEPASFSFISSLTMEMAGNIPGAGWAEIVSLDGKVVGLIYSAKEREQAAIPCSFIHSVLKARKDGRFTELGYFAFFWQTLENPMTHQFLKQKDEPSGVMISMVDPFCPSAKVLKTKDLIMEVDGFPVDPHGDYMDPNCGHLQFENLAIRNKWGGDSLKLKILRDGEVKNIDYVLPKADYSSQIVPDGVFDQDPEYLIAGGLVFQPLTKPYMKIWGGDWKHKAPFILTYYATSPEVSNRKGLIVLSQVLPDLYNIGYEYSGLVVDTINGIQISSLKDVQTALTKPKDGFHVVDFLNGGPSPRRVVLSADELEPATQRVLQKYGMASPFVIHEKK